MARHVEWVSRTRGDGLGYDVRSFDADSGDELHLEVKTTGLGKCFPFCVTANEVDCSREEPDRYRLYRIFDFSRKPRLYVLPGSLEENCRLRPHQVRPPHRPGFARGSPHRRRLAPDGLKTTVDATCVPSRQSLARSPQP